MLSITDSEKGEFIRILATDWAAKYQTTYRRAVAFQSDYCSDPRAGTEYFLQNGFERSGGGRAGYNHRAIEALNACVTLAAGYESFLKSPTAQNELWSKFESFCKRDGIGLNRQNNEGVIRGVIELAKESGLMGSNPFTGLASLTPNNVYEAWRRVRMMKGIGDKLASFLIRDIVSIMGCESSVPKDQRIFLQPIDGWVRTTCQLLWDFSERIPDWVLSAKVVLECDRLGLSAIGFNQGAWMYGPHKVGGTTDRLKENIETATWREI